MSITKCLKEILAWEEDWLWGFKGFMDNLSINQTDVINKFLGFLEREWEHAHECAAHTGGGGGEGERES